MAFSRSNKPVGSPFTRLHPAAWLPTGVVTLVLFLALEAVLALSGIPPANDYDDPFAGSAAAHPLFEPSEPGSAVMQTAQNKLRFFNYQSFLREKPEDTFRIFCIGGSTTFGRPYDDRTSYAAWLRALLPRVDPSRSWEVINAGGISYASYRITHLVRELTQYEPDLFVIHTGHNEFLERRSYGPLDEGPSPIDRVRGILGATRVYTLAQRVRGRLSASGGMDRESLLPAEVVTRLEGAVGPEDYTRENRNLDQVAEHFQHNLRRAVASARDAGAKVLLITPAANLRDCSPFKSEHRADLPAGERSDWESQRRRAREAASQGDLPTALRCLDAALKLDPKFAETHFQRGRVNYGLGRYDDALADFRRARDADICPLRAPGALIDSVRQCADALRVPLVDLERTVHERAPRGIAGSEFFLDHVHPTVDGHGVVAREILDTLAGPLGLSVVGSGDIEEIAREIHAQITTEDEIKAYRNLAQVLSWAGKFTEARANAEKVLARVPDDLDALLLVAWGTEAQNELPLAIEHYGRILELDPAHRLAPRRLAPILATQGRLEEALVICNRAVAIRPADPELQLLLGNLRNQAGDYSGAELAFRTAIRIAPGDEAGQRARKALEKLGAVEPPSADSR